MYHHYYQSYYNSVKGDLKSDHACLAIDEVARSIETNMKYVYHYHFIDVTTFDFLGNSIVEVANCGLKRGDVAASTHMNIDTSSLTQIQISKHIGSKKIGMYRAINLEIMV